MSPGGLRGLQIRRGALVVSSVGSTPMRSRHRANKGAIFADDLRGVYSRNGNTVH